MDSVGIKEKDLAVDKIRTWWRSLENTRLLKPLLIFGPFVTTLLFYSLISNKSGNVIAFATLQISLWFILISIWMLVWILK